MCLSNDESILNAPSYTHTPHPPLTSHTPPHTPSYPLSPSHTPLHPHLTRILPPPPHLLSSHLTPPPPLISPPLRSLRDGSQHHMAQEQTRLLAVIQQLDRQTSSQQVRPLSTPSPTPTSTSTPTPTYSFSYTNSYPLTRPIIRSLITPSHTHLYPLTRPLVPPLTPSHILSITPSITFFPPLSHILSYSLSSHTPHPPPLSSPTHHNSAKWWV